ncbi:MAG: hypothetical protein ABSH28_21735, partial [Acidobacteriota bacterium]
SSCSESGKQAQLQEWKRLLSLAPMSSGIHARVAATAVQLSDLTQNESLSVQLLERVCECPDGRLCAALGADNPFEENRRRNIVIIKARRRQDISAAHLTKCERNGWDAGTTSSSAQTDSPSLKQACFQVKTPFHHLPAP